jgi:ribosome-binding factor A
MSRRTERVAEALQEAVAEVVQREIKDPRVGMVTITRATVSPDLRHAKVFFSRLGDEAERRKSLEGLVSAAGFIRTQVARRLQLRVAPEIRFEIDDNIEYAVRISELIRANRPPDEGDA